MESIIGQLIISGLSIILTSCVNFGMFKARIDNLEKKVDKHNNVIERTYVLEGKVKEIQKEIHTKSKK